MRSTRFSLPVLVVAATVPIALALSAMRVRSTTSSTHAAASLLGVASLPAPAAPAQLQTVALRVSRMDAMVRFYSEAFGASFHDVRTGPYASKFGTVAGVTLKFVPIRDSVDFAHFPVHQLGFTVPDVATVIRLAERYGGRREGEIQRDGSGVHAAIRDPDGNTIELYAR